MKIIKKLLYYTVITLLVMYVSLMVLSPDRVMGIFGYNGYFVLSDSMEPEINVNDLIFSKNVPENELEVGDIITFHVYIAQFDEVSTVTHYIGAIEEVGTVTVYRTIGAKAAVGNYDEWEDEEGNENKITYNDIEGKYLFKIPYIGHIQRIFTDRKMVALLVVNIGLIYVIVQYFKSDKEDTQIEETKESND